MSDLKEPLLPPKPSSSTFTTTTSTSTRRPLFQAPDLLNLKKRGQSLRSWIRVDAATAQSQTVELDKFTIMRRCDLPARDLRLLDPLFVYPSTILGREKAIVVNLEQIRCVITADEVLLLNSLDPYVIQYVVELQRRLVAGNSTGDGYGGDYLAFEFRALEVALEAACTFLDAQASELEIEAYPLLDELTSKISTLNLERVRRLKSRLVALTRRVQKVRDEIEQLMDDDGDMAEMYLTEKKKRMETFFGDQSLQGYNSAGAGLSVSAPVSPVSSPPESRRLEKTLSIARSRHSSMKSSESAQENIEELEMLLEAYFVVIDSTLNKLTSLKEYIDDTEDFINIQLDNVRNQLIQFELILTTATFVVTIFSVVAGIFGMNFEVLSMKRQAFSSSEGSRTSKECYCREPAILTRANTDSNRGRFFLGCPNWKERNCGFFMWAGVEDVFGDNLEENVQLKTEMGSRGDSTQLIFLLGLLVGILVGIFIGFCLGRL